MVFSPLLFCADFGESRENKTLEDVIQCLPEYCIWIFGCQLTLSDTNSSGMIVSMVPTWRSGFFSMEAQCYFGIYFIFLMLFTYFIFTEMFRIFHNKFCSAFHKDQSKTAKSSMRNSFTAFKICRKGFQILMFGWVFLCVCCRYCLWTPWRKLSTDSNSPKLDLLLHHKIDL